MATITGRSNPNGRTRAHSQKLTHINQRGEAQMVDVGSKAVTGRLAIAEGQITMQAQTLQMIKRRFTRQGRCTGCGAGSRNHGRQAHR
ncbi:MAG: hypothetical protein Ct9H300mP16_12520 [Pseudomonadota bacterium]|nr:MAG: hypothetical protein Ct9H300mP16_12520 [Pseudomonadota bacterium]